MFLAMLGSKKDKEKEKKMQIEEIGEEIFENRKSQISSIHDAEEENE